MPGATKATTTRNGNGNGKVKKEDTEDDYAGSDDEPIGKKRMPNGKPKTKAPAKKKVKKEESGSDAEDDEPVTKKKARAPKKKSVKVESDAEDSDDQPVKKKAQKKAAGKKVKKEETDASGLDTPTPKKNGKAKKEAPASPKKKGKAKEEVEEDEVYRWWEAQEDPNGDGTEKWQTLVHSGVIFPPPYDPLPKGVKMKYNGE